MDDVTIFTYRAAFAILSLALILTLRRLLWGPSLADRVVALDLVAYLAMGYAAIHALSTGEYGFLSIALVIGIFVFLGTIAFARYLERATKKGKLAE